MGYMTKPRLRKTVSRQTSIIIIGVCVLAFALAYFSREPFPSSAFSATAGTQPTAVTTPETAPAAASKTQTKPVSSTKPAQRPVSQPAPAAKPASPAALSGVGSLNDLLALQKSLSCSVTVRNGTNRTGSVYLALGKFRADLANQVSVIGDGTHYYAWVRGSTSGLVLPIVSVSGSALAFHGAFDPAQSLSYGCNPWSVNAAIFIPPATVTFTDSSGN